MSRAERRAMVTRPHPGLEFEPSMPFAIDRAILALLHAQGRECGEPCANAAHR